MKTVHISAALAAALVFASCGSNSETKAAPPAGTAEAAKSAEAAAQDINTENAEAEAEKLQKEIDSDN